MTGYGRGGACADGLIVSVEVKSVNHRFLDVALKNFKSFGFAEDAVKKLVEKRAARGHIEVFLSCSDEREDAVSLKIDYNIANEYLRSAKELCGKLGIKNDLTFTALMRDNDVFKRQFNGCDEETLLALIKQSAGSALDELNAAREREGKFIKADLKTKLAGIKADIDEISARAPAVLSEYGKKLTERIKELLAGAEIDEARLLNEAAFFADRACVDEEIERLKIHIDGFFETLEDEGATGRKMDFILQEMNREINTIGGKANDIRLAEAVIRVKTELEKIREQCQNIE
jgi:uncharacterized protein (TIGR00255 family)